MKFLRYILGVTLVCALQPAHTQGLNIMDTVPDITLPINDKENIRISDLRGKLIILDFWALTCSACIRAFPKMDSLQKAFGDKIKIILVNPESKERTDQFFAVRKKLQRPNLLFISGDTLLHQLFPHYSVPYHVWIDTGSVVRYTTSGYNTNRKNISNFLQGNFFTTKNFKKVKYLNSLFDPRFTNSMEFYSYLSHCYNGIHLATGIIEGYDQIIMSCKSVAELFQRAYNKNENLNYGFNRPGRTIVEVEDAIAYVRPKSEEDLNEWYMNFSYNYHLFLPMDRANEKYELMQNELKRYFQMEVKIETRLVNCFVLVRTSKRNKLVANSPVKQNNFTWAETGSIRIDTTRNILNSPYSEFSNDFGNYIETNFERPFVDATGFGGNIDIRFSGQVIDSFDPNLLRKELGKFDMDMVEKQMPLKVLVLKKTDTPKTKRMKVNDTSILVY